MNSIQITVKNTLQGLVMPTPADSPAVPNLVAWIAPPVTGDMAIAPNAYIWGGRSREDRQTMGGGRTATIGTTAAFRDIVYDLDIFLKYAMSNSNPNIDNVFALIVDAVMIKLRGIQIPVQITDPTTGAVSQLTDIGEHTDITFGNIMSTKDQRLWVFEAHLVLRVKEKIQQ